MSPDKTDIVLGKGLNRVEGPLKVSGEAKYAAEFLPSGCKFGWLLQSTISKGEIESIDESDALNVPGVVAVITYKNALKLNSQKTSAIEPTLLVMQDNKIWHDRQNIGVVVADTIENASYGASLVRIKYKPEKPEINLHAAESQAKVWAPPDNDMMHMKTDSHRGSFETAFASSKFKINQKYSVPREVHVPMEPHATTAAWDGDRLTIWDATQGVSNSQSRLAKLFDLEKKNVRCICKFTGGGFGSKGSAWSHVPIAAMAAKMVKAPVCIAMERAQTFGPVGFRPHTQQEIRLGADADGKLTAMEHVSHQESSKFDYYVEYCALPTRFLYKCDNVNTSHRLIPQDIGKPTFMRAPGFTPGSYPLECGLDELAHAAQIDPLQLRLVNYSDMDQDKNLPYSSKALRKCYELGAEKFGWSRRNARPGATRRGNILIGYGMATSTYPAHFFPAKASVTVRDDGTVIARSGTQDIGTGTYTVMTQVVANALGVPPEKVVAELGDTDLPPAGVSGGSTTAGSVGTALSHACDSLKKALDIKDGESIFDALRRSGQTSATAEAKSDAGSEAQQYAMWSFGAQFAEVHVDAELGTIKVARFLGVYDGGKVFNHKTARSQMYGGIVMGIGQALMEHSIHDPRTGRTVNADLAEYHVPVNADVPPVEVIFVEEPDYKANVLGGHGLGELPIVGTAAAIGNAVFNATGVRVRELPITLDKIFPELPALA